MKSHVNEMGESMSPAQVAGKESGVVAFPSVADILESQLDGLIKEWLFRVEQEPELKAITLTFEERTGHLPQFLRDVIRRLRMNDGLKAHVSEAAAQHGELRSKQGYTVSMAVEESRLLQ